MAIKNTEAREWVCKVVYFGPAFAGKRTSLEHLIRHEAPGQRDLLTTITPGMPFCFDLVDAQLGTVRALKLRFELHAISGQIIDETGTRQMLRDVDAVVFVADSQEGRMAKNEAALAELREQLRGHGRELEQVPFMVVLNKRDTPTALPVDVAMMMLGLEGVAVYETVATRGTGVVEAWRACGRMVYDELRGV